MQLHFAGGNRAAALQVYEEYSRMLAAEFGGKPKPEIESLAARIRASRPAQQPRERVPLAPTPVDLSFVGRAEEFRRLMAAYQAASHRQTQVVILMGEAGIGKTRLAGEFLQWATAQGAEVLPGRAFETGGELPYQPLTQLLRHRLEQEQSPADLLSVTWLAELSRLLPELRDRCPELPQPQPDEAMARGRLLEAITRLGQALAERTPLLLFIDDIQWADLSSLEALHYAVSRWTEAKTPILLLLCARDIALVEKSNVQQWLTSLKAKLAVSQLTLASLTIEDTLALVASLEAGQSRGSQPAQVAGEELSPANVLPPPKFKALAQTLFTETGGQPLYLVETIKALLEQNVLIPYYTADGIQRLQWRTLSGETTGHFPLPRLIPPGVREAILDRLSRLTPPATAILTAAAVLGQATTFRQLAETSGIEEMAGLDALEELVAKRLLLDTNQAGQAYLIAHDKIRDVIYGETSAARRQVLHRRAVTALQGGDPARLAYHALAAEMAEEAFHYSLVAGDAALYLFAAGEAATHYEVARKIMMAGQVPQVEVDKVQHLYVSLGRALELNAQFEPAGAVYEELKIIARQRAAPALKLAALMAQVTHRSMLSQSFNPVHGEALAEEALNMARALSDPAAEAKILWSLLNFYIPFNRLPQAIVCGEQALVLARNLNLPEQTAFILNDMMKCYLLSGRLEQAREVVREARELWRELNNLPMLADSLAGSADLARWAGDYDLALTFSAEAFQISQTIANVWGQSYSKLSIGNVYWDRGQPDKAIAVMEECLRLAEMADYLLPQILTRAELGTVYGSLGAIEQGLATIRLALTVADTHLPILRSYVLGKLAQLHLWQSHLSQAEAIIEQAKKDSNQQPFPLYFQYVLLAETELILRQGDHKCAQVETDALMTNLHQFGMWPLMPEVLYLQGQCLAGLGQPEAARNALLEAHSKAEVIGSRRVLWPILFALSRIENDPIEADRLRQQAQQVVKQIAANIGNPELQASFLDLAEVKELLTL